MLFQVVQELERLYSSVLSDNKVAKNTDDRSVG